MCLNSLLTNPMYDNYKERVVYKILRKDNSAPYKREYKYSYGLNTAKEPAEGNNSNVHLIHVKYMPYVNTPVRYCVLEGGYLHAYCDKAYAKKIKKLLYQQDKDNARILGKKPEKFKVVEMRIPIGVEYWMGDANDICAKQLYWEKPIYRFLNFWDRLFD